MRIAIIAPFQVSGGIEQQIILLLRGLQERGVDSVLFHLEIQSVELLKQLESIPDCKHIEIRIRPLKNFGLLLFDALELANKLREYECDLVHGWTYKGHVIGSLAAKLARIPCIFTIGGLDPWKKSWQLQFFRLINRLADGFVFQSTSERDIVSERESIPLERTRIIPNGLDQHLFRKSDSHDSRSKIRNQFDLSSSLPLILSVGRLRFVKGHDVLIEAVRKIYEEQSGLQFHLLIIGEGPLREDYEASIGSLPITITGFRTDVQDFYHSADLYCQPSRSEGLPNAVIEAMSCGLPIVATDVGGMGELVTGANGLLCKADDPDILAMQLQKMLDNSQHWPSMSRASVNLSERFSDKAMVDAYISAYTEVLRNT